MFLRCYDQGYCLGVVWRNILKELEVPVNDRLKMHDRIRIWEPQQNLSCSFCNLFPNSFRL
ncbi:hypothetical protein LXL04_001940 [Taraxacum kok-saghyz]